MPDNFPDNVECNLSKDNLEGSVFAEGLGLLFVQKSEINKDIYQWLKINQKKLI